MEIPTDHKELLEEEWYHVRHSGEIPEIALHGSLYHLTEDDEGPRISLGSEALEFLQDAARQRYFEMILRDITPANRDATMYRGVLRAISNWRRFKRFCQRHQMSQGTVRDKIGQQFLLFLENEVSDVQGGLRQSCINCTIEDIVSVTAELDVKIEHIKTDLNPLCLNF